MCLEIHEPHLSGFLPLYMLLIAWCALMIYYDKKIYENEINYKSYRTYFGLSAFDQQ